MTITELLKELRGLFGNEKEKGTPFKKLIKIFLELNLDIGILYQMFGLRKIFLIERL